MSAFSDYVTGLSPFGYWRFNDLSGDPVDSIGNHTAGYTGTSGITYGADGRTDDGDTAIFLDGSWYSSIENSATWTGGAVTAFSFLVFPALPADPEIGLDDGTLWQCRDGGVDITIQNQRIDNVGYISVSVTDGLGNSSSGITDNEVDLTAIRTVLVTFSSGTITVYVDGAAVAFTHDTQSAGSFDPGTYSNHFCGSWFDEFYGAIWRGTFDDAAIWWGSALSAQVAADIHQAAGGDVALSVVVPITLRGYLSYTGNSIPVRLLGGNNVSGSSIPLTLTAPDPVHFTAAACTFSVKVVLDGTDISARITGPVRISHEENSSGLCTIEITPEQGTLDLADYERKSLAVDFVGLDSDGSTLYTRRRWTGITSTATHDPDTGTLTVEGTTDLQGLIEAWSREVIENALPGTLWSQHIFDETADGWQYALDRMSTLPAEIHLDEWGRFVLVPWAAKATPDIVYTDAERFDGSLRLDRVAIRDLLTRITINIDFRYARLRYREIGVGLSGGLSFCEWLDGWGTAPSKDMIRSAADGSEWTRVSDITFNTFPPAGSYCNPLRGWIPTDSSEALCLTARWKAARRWAQTVTEQYAITVYAPDLEEAVGQIALEEDYGLEAIYDATDYEQDRSWNERPGGFVLKAATNDWESEATDVEYAGRAELEIAEECAIEKAKTEILRRARLNRVTFSPVYRPDVSLSSTVEVDTPCLACTGKVARIEETIDPTTGTLDQTLEIAISRHGGSGLAATTPTAPVPQPEMPAEEPTPRSYTVQYRIGGTTNAQEDNPEWDGFVTNVQPFRRVPGEPLYETRFVLNMPEIESAARESIEVPAAESFELEVPEDPLTIGV